MSNQDTIFIPGDRAQSWRNVDKVVFKGSPGSWIQKYSSLYKGMSAALLYKVSQRVYRFGGQPLLAESLDRNYGDWFSMHCGPKYCKPWMHAITGAMVGVGEVLIVPFDVLKIKRQTNPEALQGRSILTLIRTENFKLYQGSFWTAARNGPGSFALFGGAALAKDLIFGLEDYNSATVTQNFVASVVGAMCCIVVANPLDVVKTRVQRRHFDDPISGRVVIRALLKKEGLGGFFKGFTPKMLVVGPKLIFAFTSAQTLIQYFDAMFEDDDD